MEKLMIDILCWAAGRWDGLGNSEPVREDVLLAAARSHKIRARLLHRILSDHPRWCGESLAENLARSVEDEKRRMRKQIEATHEISEALALRGEHVITVKGVATYALTGDERTIHHSGDIDLLTSDVETLRQTLLGLGYTQGRTGWHEYALMARDDVVVEVDREFPVETHLRPVVTDAMVPACNPGTWIQSDDTPGLAQSAIGYVDLAAHSLLGLAAGTTGLRIPSPSMAALISCAHMFRHTQSDVRNVVRLGELASLRDIVGHPLFNWREFRDLVEVYNARYAVEFVGRLFSTYLGHSPLAPLGLQVAEGAAQDVPLTSTPYNIRSIWAGWFWAALEPEPDEFIESIYANMGRLLDRIGFSTILATESGEEEYGSGCPTRPLERTIVRDCQGERLPVRLSAAWSEAGLTLRLVLPSLPDGLYDYVYMDLGYSYYTYFYCTGNEVASYIHWTSFEYDLALMALEDGQYSVRIDLPWKQLPALADGRDCLSLVLGLARLTKSEELSAGTLLPLRVVRSS